MGGEAEPSEARSRSCYLVKIEPSLFLVARTPMKPRVLEMPLQVPVGRLPLENKQATGNGAGERIWASISGGRGLSLQGFEGANGPFGGNSFTLGGGGNFCGYGTFGHALAGVAGNDWRTGVKLLAIKLRFRLKSCMVKLKPARKWKNVGDSRNDLGEQPAKVKLAKHQ